jgi:hypothetical protein
MPLRMLTDLSTAVRTSDGSEWTRARPGAWRRRPTTALFHRLRVSAKSRNGWAALRQRPLKIGNDAMHSELSDASLNAIQKATKPISLSEIGAACLGRTKPNAKLEEVLKQLVGRAVIHEWPSYRRSQIFGSRPLRSAVEDAFVAALDDAPLTIAKAAKPVSRVLGRVSEERVLAELRGLAPKLAASRKIMQVPVNRQSVVYISMTYHGRIVPAKAATSDTGALRRGDTLFAGIPLVGAIQGSIPAFRLEHGQTMLETLPLLGFTDG